MKNKFLHELRISKNMTTRNLAERIGYSFGYISAVENGTKCNPSNNFIEKYLRALSEDVDEYNINLKLYSEVSDNIYFYERTKTMDVAQELIEIKNRIDEVLHELEVQNEQNRNN